MIRTVFFGTPDFAVTCLEALWASSKVEVLAVVTAPDRPSGRGQSIQSSPVARFAEAHRIPVLKPERLRDEVFLAELSALGADVFTVVAFRMLPELVWAMPRLGSLNIHGSLLPDLRGAAPIQWSLAHGDSVTGLTAFSLNARIDEGPILAQVELAVGPDEPLGSLYPRMAQAGAQLAVQVLTDLAQNKRNPRAQSESSDRRAAPKLGPEFARLELLDSAFAVHNRIRACDPLPGASLPSPEREGDRFKVFASTYRANSATQSKSSVCYIIDNESIMIIDEIGTAQVHEVQWPGKRRMPTLEFLRGSRIRGRFTLSGQKID